MDWSGKYDKSRHRLGGVAAVHVTYHDDSDACMLQCLLVLFFYFFYFFYSFSILSGHDLGILFSPAIVKMYCLSKVILLLFPASLFFSLLGHVFQIMILFNAAKV